MGTRIRLVQVAIEPEHLVAAANLARTSEHGLHVEAGEEGLPAPELLEATRLVEHAAGGSCQVAGVTHIGGGNTETGRWLIDVIVLEPAI